jgi:hypothetical protein
MKGKVADALNLVIAIRLKSVGHSHMEATFLFYVLQKYYINHCYKILKGFSGSIPKWHKCWEGQATPRTRHVVVAFTGN